MLTPLGQIASRGTDSYDGCAIRLRALGEGNLGMADLRVVPDHWGGPIITTEVRGRGPCPVVFVPGLGDTGAESFTEVMSELEGVAQLVGYARPGVGGSGPARDTDPRGVVEAAEELRVALGRARVSSPRILVGHSYGSLIAFAFVATWPEDVAGVVLVDASVPQLFLESGREFVDDGGSPGSIPFDVTITAEELEDLPSPVGVPASVVASRPGRWLDLPPEQAEQWAPHTLAEIDARWQAHQAALAERLDADLVVAEAGGHYVQRDQPELVAAAIRWMLP